MNIITQRIKYASPYPYHSRFQTNIRPRMQGFIVFDFAKEYPVAREQIGRWLAEGKLQRKETIIKGGVAGSEDALNHLFQGKNIGKWPTSDARHDRELLINALIRKTLGGGQEPRRGLAVVREGRREVHPCAGHGGLNEVGLVG